MSTPGAVRLFRCEDGTYHQHVGPTDETDLFALPWADHAAREAVVGAAKHLKQGVEQRREPIPDSLKGPLAHLFAALARLDNPPTSPAVAEE